MRAVRKMSRVRILRIQDAEGRGPYKPGMSSRWTDDHGDPPPPTWMEEFGDITRQCADDEYLGCGCRTLDQLFKWFTPTERVRLRRLGYQIVVMWADRVIAESVNQIVFARKKPLAMGATVIADPYRAPPPTTPAGNTEPRFERSAPDAIAGIEGNVP